MIFKSLHGMSIDILSSEFLSFYCSLPLAWISCLGLCDPGEFLDWFRGSLEISWLNGTRVLYFWPGLAIHMNFKLELWHPSNFVTWTGWSVCIPGLDYVIHMNFKVGLLHPSYFVTWTGWSIFMSGLVRVIHTNFKVGLVNLFLFITYISWLFWMFGQDWVINMKIGLRDLFEFLIPFGWSFWIVGLDSVIC